jgi:Zn-dependent peptidase ImmA (M78 family)
MKKDFVSCKKWLRKNFPIKTRVFIRLVSEATIIRYMKQDGAKVNEEDKTEYYHHGYFREETFEDKRGKQNTLYINKDDSPKNRIDSLIHEYAHALQYQEPHSPEGHGPIYQKYYKRLIRRWEACTKM